MLMLNPVVSFPVITQYSLLASITNPKILFDKHMETLEIQLDANKFKAACREAKISADIINSNIDEFKKIEPNYNWKEIKNVLLEIPKKHCKQ